MADYRSHKISGSEALYQGGSAAISLFLGPIASIIKDVGFEEVPLY